MENLHLQTQGFRNLLKQSCQVFMQQFGLALFAMSILMPVILLLGYLYPHYAAVLLSGAPLLSISLTEYWSLVFFFLSVPSILVFLLVVAACMVQRDPMDDEEGLGLDKLLGTVGKPFFELLPRMLGFFLLHWCIWWLGDQILDLARAYWVHHSKLPIAGATFAWRSRLLWYAMQILRGLVGAAYLLARPTILHSFASYRYATSSKGTFQEALEKSRKALKGQMRQARLYTILYRLPVLMVPLLVGLFSWLTGEPSLSLLGGVLSKLVIGFFFCLTLLFSMVMRATFWRLFAKRIPFVPRKADPAQLP